MSSEVSQAFAFMPLPSAELETSPAHAPLADETAPRSAAEERSRFNDFYTKHAQFVARSLRRLGIHDELLDDALQEVFVVVYRKLPQLQGDEHEKTWVFRITMNVAANLRRQNQRWLTKLGGGSEALPQDLTSPDDQLGRLLQDERLALLYQVLGTLDEDKRNVFVLHELEQLGVPEVAEALGLNLNTAYSRLRAARAAFEHGVQQHLEKHGRVP
jgi:RNA polymerase sigma-70 factor (ECF subfamily)